MTIKEENTLNYWWMLLFETVEHSREGQVSAGQVAKRAGTSVNTARKYLDKLVNQKAATWTAKRLPNGVKAKYYWAIEVKKAV